MPLGLLFPFGLAFPGLGVLELGSDIPMVIGMLFLGPMLLLKL